MMGYRYTLIIGMDKKILTRALIDNTFFPKILQEEPPIIHIKGGYWRLTDVTAYEWEALDRFFKLLDDADPEWDYGAMAVGEDNDLECWGCPSSFGIYDQRSIDCFIFDQ
jgi:hypothetical protein